MSNSENISKILNQVLYPAIDQVNLLVSDSEKIEKNVNAVLYGLDGKIDSLGLVNLVVTVEEKVEELYGKALRLVNEKALSQKNSPFQSLQTLAVYIDKVLEETK